MFDSQERLARDIGELLRLIRSLADGRYACLAEPGRVVFEDPPSEESGNGALRRFIDDRTADLFRIPAALAAGDALDDVFDGWDTDDFVLAILNGRVALVVACPDGERLRARIDDPLRALADRLLRWNAAYRLDPHGRGLFFSTPKLDVVVVSREADRA
jgi:hypothetical protein